MKEKLRNKKVIAGIIIVVAFTMIITVIVMTKPTPLKLKSNEVNVEYGQQLSLDPGEYLDEDKNVIDQTTASIQEDIVFNEGKDYLPIGEYTLILNYQKEKAEIKVIVKDTTAPVFKKFKDTQEIIVGNQIDYAKLYNAEDLSQVEITVDDTKVKYDIAGEYKAIVTAVDIFKNKTSQEVSIKIKEEEKKEDETDIAVTSKSNPTNQTSQSSNTTNNQPEKPKDSSSQDERKEDTDKTIVANLKVAKSASKILIVSSNSYSSTKGHFSYYQKQAGQWKEKLNTSCILGKSGMGSGAENSRKTPVGIYHFTHLMGIASNPGTLMNYHKIDDNDYWCGEAYYNQFIDEDNHEHNCSKKNDEHLISYANPYKYLAAFNYNPGNTPGKGFAYFLHVSGGSSYTMGCIGINESSMRKIMQIIDSDTVMIVDLEKNITHY